MLPEGWGVRKLEDIAVVERGKFSVRPRNDPRYFGGDMPFVQTGDVSAAGLYLTKYSQTLNEEGVKVSKVFPENSILITIAANIGDTAITKFEIACPDSVVAIIPKKNEADFYWLKKAMECKKDELDSKATQNAQKNINLQVLKPLELLTPPIKEQRKISEILSTWDKGIEITEKLIQNSQQQKKALMQQLLTGKKRLPGFEGEWKERNIEYAFRLITDYVSSGSFASLKENVSVFDNEGFAHYVRQTDLASGFKNKNLKFVDDKSYTYLKKSNLFFGDILFTNIGDLGKVYYMPKLERPATVAPNLIVLRANNKYCSRYLFYLLDSDVGQKEIHKIKSGTGLPKISKTEFKTLKFIFPEFEEQQEISNIILNSDLQILSLEKQVEKLRSEKQALMKQLLTGKKRVMLDAA